MPFFKEGFTFCKKWPMMTSRAILICFSLCFFFYLFSFSATEQLPFSPQTLQIRVRVVHYLPPGLTAKSDTSRCGEGGTPRHSWLLLPSRGGYLREQSGDSHLFCAQCGFCAVMSCGRFNYKLETHSSICPTTNAWRHCAEEKTSQNACLWLDLGLAFVIFVNIMGQFGNKKDNNYRSSEADGCSWL